MEQNTIDEGLGKMKYVLGSHQAIVRYSSLSHKVVVRKLSESSNLQQLS